MNAQADIDSPERLREAFAHHGFGFYFTWRLGSQEQCVGKILGKVTYKGVGPTQAAACRMLALQLKASGWVPKAD